MKGWRYINILSLDVAAGAMTGCAFFARIFGIEMLPHALVALGLIVWIIYTVDHLIDARNTTGEPSTDRHRFHKRYAQALMALLIIAGIVVMLEAFYVRKPVLFAGIGIAILVLGYIALQASLKYAKEIVGALLYTAGVVAGPWSLLNRAISAPELLLVLLFGITAMINLMLFSLIDRDSDLVDRRASFATIYGPEVTRNVLVAGFVIVAALCALLLIDYMNYTSATITILIMNVVLFFTFYFREYMRRDDRYRRVGDLAFLIPGFYLIYGWI